MKPTDTEPAHSGANSYAGSTWEPFRLPLFRALFAAQLGSNIGNWMETVGAQWLLVHEPNASTLARSSRPPTWCRSLSSRSPPASSPTSSIAART